RAYPEFTMHPMCGAATFIVVEDGAYKPITHYVDVDKFAEIFWEIYYMGIMGKRTIAKMKMLEFIPMVKSSLVRDLLKDVITKGSYKALGKFMRKIVMIGIMHFMDVWNFDLDRAQRCVIHYATPDGKIRSFCTYNSFHRSKIEKEFSIPVEDWMKKTGKRLNEPV
ncbi:MAG: radical SAM protein, partial [Candidatus Bathyarchaeia archaeon]